MSALVRTTGGSAGGIAGLTREEVGEPVGNTLTHNLIRDLMESTTLVPPDLQLMDYGLAGVESPDVRT